jgi:hypothetical protein
LYDIANQIWNKMSDGGGGGLIFGDRQASALDGLLGL